jgi:hypothetical protein
MLMAKFDEVKDVRLLLKMYPALELIYMVSRSHALISIYFGSNALKSSLVLDYGQG